MWHNRFKSIIYLPVLIILSTTSCQESTDPKQSKVTATNEITTPNQVLPAILQTSQNDRRAIWQKPEIVLKKIGNATDKVIADIGAGSGYFAFKILPTCKKIIAIDIDQEAIAYMDSIAMLLPDPYRSNFETRLGAVHDAKLAHGEADIILLVNTYLYLDGRIDYLKHLKSRMATNGRIIIIDYKKKKIPTGPEASQRVALSVAEQELESAGFTLVESDDHSLDYQYVITAK